MLRGHPYFRGQVCRQEAGEDEDITIVRFATAFGALAACPIPPPLRYPDGESFSPQGYSTPRIRVHDSNPQLKLRDAHIIRWSPLFTIKSDGSLDKDAFIAGYAEALTDLLLRDFRKNFLGAHRKLAKSVGFVAPRKGPGARFVLSDNLLKALTLANVSSDSGMTYDEFLARLHERYGLVVGPIEAREAGLLERRRINVEYYDRNRTALLDKMKHSGLAVEYSDATAVIGG